MNYALHYKQTDYKSATLTMLQITVHFSLLLSIFTLVFLFDFCIDHQKDYALFILTGFRKRLVIVTTILVGKDRYLFIFWVSKTSV